VDVTSLALLLHEEGTALLPDGLQVTALSSWIVPGEDRLSYTTLVRLIECCREHHWEQDIFPLAGGQPIDSITKSLAVSFARPIVVGTIVSIGYRVLEAHGKSYTLEFEIRERQSETLCAECTLVCVFYDPQHQCVSIPPPAVTAYLRAACRQFSS
jgi:acyl-CoA thioesterase FadM